MVWNYRVVRVMVPRPASLGAQREPAFLIKEVYYNKDGSIYAMSVDGIQPVGETVEELEQDLKYMMEALRAEVLVEEDVKFVDRTADDK